MPDYSFEHVHLVSPDPAQTAQFYIRYLGAVPDSIVTTPSGGKAIRLKLKDTLIIISPPRANSPFRGLEHFGLVTADLKASIAELQAAGCSFRGEPVSVSADTTIAFFETPDKVLIELVEYRSRP
jgi:catechol 2,3-dioxygenase-like lactoylglutathione lyase family enzyme